MTESEILLGPLSGWNVIHYFLGEIKGFSLGEGKAKEIAAAFKEGIYRAGPETSPADFLVALAEGPFRSDPHLPPPAFPRRHRPEHGRRGGGGKRIPGNLKPACPDSRGNGAGPESRPTAMASFSKGASMGHHGKEGKPARTATLLSQERTGSSHALPAAHPPPPGPPRHGPGGGILPPAHPQNGGGSGAEQHPLRLPGHRCGEPDVPLPADPRQPGDQTADPAQPGDPAGRDHSLRLCLVQRGHGVHRLHQPPPGGPGERHLRRQYRDGRGHHAAPARMSTSPAASPRGSSRNDRSTTCPAAEADPSRWQLVSLSVGT